MAYHSILVIGGSGFIGSHVVAKLSATECVITVPTHRLAHAEHLLELPAVEDVIEADVHDDAVLSELIRGKDAVINLVGILHGKPGPTGTPYGPEFERAHVELPRRIVAACTVHGVRRYLHMSALGADRNGPSMYQRSKADGELAVFSHPTVLTTVFRPSVVFGDHDHFLNMFASLQKLLPMMLVASAEAKFQPVYVEDVAQAFVHALNDDDTFGKIYELAGPKVYTLRELVQLAGLYSGHRRPVLSLPEPLARAEAFVLEHLSDQPLLSRDNLDSMKVDNVAHSGMASALQEFGIEATSIEAVAPYYLQGRRPHAGVETLHVKH